MFCQGCIIWKVVLNPDPAQLVEYNLCAFEKLVGQESWKTFGRLTNPSSSLFIYFIASVSDIFLSAQSKRGVYLDTSRLFKRSSLYIYLNYHEIVLSLPRYLRCLFVIGYNFMEHR